MASKIFIQRSTRKLTIYADSCADIDGISVDNSEIGLFMRQYAAEQIEDEYTGGHEHAKCCDEEHEEC
jgi:hypothetical protein